MHLSQFLLKQDPNNNNNMNQHEHQSIAATQGRPYARIAYHEVILPSISDYDDTGNKTIPKEWSAYFNHKNYNTNMEDAILEKTVFPTQFSYSGELKIMQLKNLTVNNVVTLAFSSVDSQLINALQASNDRMLHVILYATTNPMEKLILEQLTVSQLPKRFSSRIARIVGFSADSFKKIQMNTALTPIERQFCFNDGNVIAFMKSSSEKCSWRIPMKTIMSKCTVFFTSTEDLINTREDLADCGPTSLNEQIDILFLPLPTEPPAATYHRRLLITCPSLTDGKDAFLFWDSIRRITGASFDWPAGFSQYRLNVRANTVKKALLIEKQIPDEYAADVIPQADPSRIIKLHSTDKPYMYFYAVTVARLYSLGAINISHRRLLTHGSDKYTLIIDYEIAIKNDKEFRVTEQPLYSHRYPNGDPIHIQYLDTSKHMYALRLSDCHSILLTAPDNTPVYQTPEFRMLFNEVAPSYFKDVLLKYMTTPSTEQLKLNSNGEEEGTGIFDMWAERFEELKTQDRTQPRSGLSLHLRRYVDTEWHCSFRFLQTAITHETGLIDDSRPIDPCKIRDLTHLVTRNKSSTVPERAHEYLIKRNRLATGHRLGKHVGISGNYFNTDTSSEHFKRVTGYMREQEEWGDSADEPLPKCSLSMLYAEDADEDIVDSMLIGTSGVSIDGASTITNTAFKVSDVYKRKPLEAGYYNDTRQVTYSIYFLKSLTDTMCRMSKCRVIKPKHETMRHNLVPVWTRTPLLQNQVSLTYILPNLVVTENVMLEELTMGAVVHLGMLIFE